jgi:ubiquinone/menaquinone biosynthesis C-methylase UbiE
MDEQKKADAEYVLGRSERETKRLQQQGDMTGPMTRTLLQRAGISTGMRVLELGSGAGDVALIAAELVGPAGSVVGVDANPAVLERARERARLAGMTHLSFVASDIREARFTQEFDALIGRYVLVYVADPVAVLRTNLRYVRPGGIVAFHEMDFGLCELFVDSPGSPPLYRQVYHQLMATFRRAGMHLRMGHRLPETFLAAGLPFPQLQLDGNMGGGPDWIGYSILVQSFESALPKMIEYGIVQEGEVDLSTLTARLRDEIAQRQAGFITHINVGAWAYKV